jgi:flagellar motor switch protein FliN/FliY
MNMVDNGNILSEEEIQALLQVAGTTKNKDEPNFVLDEIERDTLGEIGNISFSTSATTLAQLLNHEVKITTPHVSLVKKTGLKKELPRKYVRLKVSYIEGLHGDNLFIIKASDASMISNIMLGGDGLSSKEALSEIELSAIQEVMNQMMGSSATSMSTVFNKRITISPPVADYIDVDTLEEVDYEIDGDMFVKVAFKLEVGELIHSTLIQLIPFHFAKDLVDQLLNPDEPEEPVAVSSNQTHFPNNQIQAEKAMKAIPDNQYIGSSVNEQSRVQTAAFSDFDRKEMPEKTHRNLDLLMDIPLHVTVELGRTKKRVEDILDLSSGSIIELDKLAGEPVDVLVNQKLIAKGEVVVIDENFGIRVTDIISQKDRLTRLN